MPFGVVRWHRKSAQRGKKEGKLSYSGKTMSVENWPFVLRHRREKKLKHVVGKKGICAEYYSSSVWV